jgi:hypothetical protein
MDFLQNGMEGLCPILRPAIAVWRKGQILISKGYKGLAENGLLSAGNKKNSDYTPVFRQEGR